MSVAYFGVVFGILKYKNTQYKLLNLPVEDFQLWEKIKRYMNQEKQDLLFSTAPWRNRRYIFEIQDNTLYFTYIHFDRQKSYQTDNEMMQIFGKNKMLVNFSGTLKVFSRKEQRIEHGSLRTHFYVIYLRFEKGKLQEVEKVSWKPIGIRPLKNYIPE